jgi:hypothetical protein
MAFTQVTITGSYTTQAGAAASGSVTFTLTEPMENANVIINPAPVTVTLDGSGHFSTTLAANDDAATVPQSAIYGVTELISGAQPRDYFITVSHATNPVDISTLMPGEVGWT